MTGKNDIKALLRQVGEMPDDELDIAETALLLASLDRPGVSPDRYRDHLALIADDLAGAAAGLETLEQRIGALNNAIFTAQGYEGDRRCYDDIQNANLMRVIDRRRGLPVTLGILVIGAARAQGWNVSGLCFPGHFLLRIDHRGQRAILDPFEKGALKSAADLRALLRAQGDDDAELTPSYYRDASDREVLVRLQNNIKLRQTQCGDNLAAAATLETMLSIAPLDKNLWREKAFLAARMGRIDGAVAALEQYISRETLEGPRHDAALLLQKLRGQ